MKKKTILEIRNLGIMFMDNDPMVIATKTSFSDDINFIDVVYENHCPTCPEEIERYPIGTCKILKKESVKFKDINNEDADILQSIMIDLKMKYGEIGDDEEIQLITIKNSFINGDNC